MNNDIDILCKSDVYPKGNGRFRWVAAALRYSTGEILLMNGEGASPTECQDQCREQIAAWAAGPGDVVEETRVVRIKNDETGVSNSLN